MRPRSYRRFSALITAGVAALAIAGCGGQSQKEVRACWNRDLDSYAQQWAKSFAANDIPGGKTKNLSGLIKATTEALGEDAALYEAHDLTRKSTDPGDISHFKATEAKCGKITMGKKG